MNEIILHGTLTDIKPSHVVNNNNYDCAKLLVRNSNQNLSTIDIIFKHFQNIRYKEGDLIDIVGNVRSYSQQLEDKNQVQIYVFTYLDSPQKLRQNEFKIDGSICILEDLRYTNKGKCCIHFVLANNILVGDKKLNSYLPCVAWGVTAKKLAQLRVGSKIAIEGEMRSREYKKKTKDKEFEIKVAHELLVTGLAIYEE